MNTTTALFKKEFHTAKWVLLGGILFFWSFPLLEGTGTYFRSGTFRTDIPSEISWMFGGLFAIITACGLVCMDMPKGLYEFWRSRPVRLLPYMTVKYIVGLAVTLFVITVPLLLEIYLFRNADHSNSFGRSILCCHTFVILLIYSIAFCAGHLFRNMTETVIISCAAMLLIYFVPVLVPAMEPLSFFNLVTDGPAPNMEIVAKLGPNETPKSSIYPRTNWGYSFWGNRHMYWMSISSKSLVIVYVFKGFWLFTGTLSALSAVLIAGAWVCLKYHLQIRLGLKSLCWSLGLVGLILFSAAAFSVASNLTCLAKISLPAEGEKVSPITFCFDDKGGVMLGGRYNKSESPRYSKLQIDRITEEPSYAYRHESYPLEILLPSHGLFYGSRRIVWSEQAPDIVYFLGSTGESEQGKEVLCRYRLYVIKLDDGTHTARVLGELPTGEYDAEKWKYYSEDIALDYPKLYLRLPGEVAVVDVSDDKQPRLLTKFMPQNGPRGGQKENWKVFNLPSDKTLSEEQRRRIVRYFGRGWRIAWDGNRCTEASYDFVCVYETREISPTEVRLEKIARRNLLPLEKLMRYDPSKTILRGDMVYQLCNNGRLTVYGLNKSLGTLKNIGHYTAPEGRFYDMLLREDGLITLVGNKQIHIVQPPAIKTR